MSGYDRVTLNERKYPDEYSHLEGDASHLYGVSATAEGGAPQDTSCFDFQDCYFKHFTNNISIVSGVDPSGKPVKFSKRFKRL